MSGHTRGRSTTGTSWQRPIGRWLVVAVLVVSLAATVVWLPAGAAATASNLTVADVTPVDSEVEAGEPLPVEIALNNTGSTEASNQTLSLAVDTAYDPDDPNFTVINETTVSLNASETTTRTLSYDTEVGDGEEIEVRATTEDDPDGATATATISDDPPAEPGTYRGTINASGDIAAPVGTNVTARVDGDVQDTFTVETRGEYGDTGFNDTLTVEADAGEDYVNFTVDGTEATNSPVAHETTDNVVNLTFPDGTFRAPMAVSINDTESMLTVSDTDNISVVVDLENTLTDTTLTETISASVDGTTRASQEVTLGSGETDSITLTFPAETAFDDKLLTVTSEQGSDTGELTVERALVEVDSVEDFETNHEFVGVVRDPGNLTLTATVGANETPITGNVTLQVVRDGAVLYDGGQIPVENGSFAATVDPADFPIDTTTGQATVELGSEPAGTIGLYHEVESRSEGVHPISVPQPAQLHVDGEFRATKWDASSGSYSSSGLDTSGDFSTSAAVHEGLYLLSDEPIRVGFEFEPDDGGTSSPGTESITPGWTLLGSNYDISSNDYLPLIDDLSIAGADVDAYSAAGEPLDDFDRIYPYDAYWVHSDSTISRGVTTPGYNATDRGR